MLPDLRFALSHCQSYKQLVQRALEISEGSAEEVTFE